MTAYSPSVHRTVVAANGESSRKFHSINKLLIDMDAAGMIKIAAQDLAPGDTTIIWLDLTIPEDGNGQAKVYDGGSWVPLTPEYFVLHYGASTADAAASALAAANSASAAEGFKNQTISDASATAADVLTADAAKVAALAAQSAAEQARDEAEIAADNFDDVYLGSKATDPTLDNDGDALVEGQLYWSSATNALKVYDGASWISYSAASGITDLVDDTSPQLGGNLDLNGHVITGLEIGTNVQAQSSNLDSWSMVVPSDYLTTTAAAAAYQPVSSTLTSLAGASANGVSLATAADYAAMRGLLDLEAGTDFLSPSAISAAYQPLSARLSDVAGLAVTDGNIIVGNGSNWVAESGGTARTSLGLGTGNSPQFAGVNLTEAAAPSTPASGLLALYAKTDGKLYSKDDEGNETEIGKGRTASRNRIVNGALQISQQNVNNAGTTNDYYVADQFSVHRVTSAGTITAQRVQSVTPGGAKDRVRITITTQDTSLDAGEYLYLQTRLEGLDVVDFGYGAAGARAAMLRFLFKGPAGTYAVSLTNSATNRSYVALFSPAAANTDEIIEIAIPGDTSGTWLTDTGVGIEIRVVLACGSTFQGSAGWQAGNMLGTSGVSNGMGTSSDVFEFGEFGFYLDLQGAGVAPAWELPDVAREMQRCQRYYCKSFPIETAPQEGYPSTWKAGFAWSTTSIGIGSIQFPVRMCAAPTLTFFKPNPIAGTNGRWQWYDGTSAYKDSSTTGAANNYITDNDFSVNLTVSGATTRNAYIVQGNWVADARL